MIARIRAALQHRRDAKARSRRVGKALRDFAQYDLEMRGRAPEPSVVTLPPGFTCLRCEENPALPTELWCAVCTRIIDALPVEPCDHGGIEGSMARHPAGKRLPRTGGDQ